MHPRNLHHDRYDLNQLSQDTPELAAFIQKSPAGQDTVDFTNAEAVKILNRAILKTFYGIQYWDIPQNFLTPPVPGRSDYLHYLKDLLGGIKNVRGLDIGTGANLIYPLLGHALYGWSFVGSEVNPEALKSAQNIIEKNHLDQTLEVRPQLQKESIFSEIMDPEEKFSFSMCNPPFHESAKVAREGTERKWKNLGHKGKGLNFGGQSNELWCKGGERAFILKMIDESILYQKNITWFTTLVSQKDNLSILENALKKIRPKEVKVIEMAQGQKKSRILAWKF